MKPSTCPYLSIKEDPETQLAFPSVRNCCRRARPIVPVNLEHQSTHCLSPNFTYCPVPLNQINTPLPEDLRAVVPSKKGYFIVAAITVMIIAGIIIMGLWQSGFLTGASTQVPKDGPGLYTTPSPLTTLKIIIPESITPALFTSTAYPTFVPTDPPTPSITPTPSKTPTLRATPTRTQEIPPATDAICNPPSGWVEYIVQPDDSLYQIGVYYGVTVLELQEANCMGSSELIYVGQVLYVPNIPTRTPPRYSTRIPTRTVTQTKRNEPRTKTPVPTNTPLPSVTPKPTNTPKPTSPPKPTDTLTPAPLPTKTFPPPPTSAGDG